MVSKLLAGLAVLTLVAYGAVAGPGCPEDSKCKGKSATLTKGEDGTTKAAGGGGCCAKKAAAKVAEGSGGCSKSDKVSGALASLPSIKYRVGEETMCCPKAAGFMAEKNHQPVKYVVGSEAFDTEALATARLVTLLNEEVESMKTVQYAVGDKCMKCPMTAKSVADQNHAKMTYRVAGVDFEDKEKAEKAAKLASEAVEQVKLSYKVGDKSFCCSKMAGESVKESGKPMTYVVGETEVQDEASAKVLFAQEQVRVMAEAAFNALQS